MKKKSLSAKKKIHNKLLTHLKNPIISKIYKEFQNFNKFNLNKFNFIIGCFFLIIKHLITFLMIKPGYFLRIIGNFLGLVKLFFNIKKT